MRLRPLKIRRPLNRLRGRTRPAGSLRRRVTWGFAVATTLLLIGAFLAALGLSTAGHDRDRLLDQVDPAIEYAGAYEIALVNQSAGARLYAATGTSSSLATYQGGVTAAVAAEAHLDADLRSIAGIRPHLQRINALTAAWQAQYLRALVAQPRPEPAAALVLITGATLAFSSIRAEFAVLQNGLEHVRRGAVRGFDDALNLLEGVVIAVFAGIAGVLLAVWISVHRSVLAPLSAIGADSRRVTAGEFDRPVAARGPIEIGGLARDIDAMRSRVVEDLYNLESAHRDLARQRHELEETSTELARSNRDLEQFAYVASHDLQEPLRKVAAFCQLLSERYHDRLDERGQQYIDFAVDGAKRMQSLVSDLLSFSRVGRTPRAAGRRCPSTTSWPERSPTSSLASRPTPPPSPSAARCRRCTETLSCSAPFSRTSSPMPSSSTARTRPWSR